MLLIEKNTEFHIVTSLELYDDFDGNPIKHAFECHLINSQISLIHILTENSIDDILTTLPILNNTKIKIIKCSQRPTFKDFFEYCNKISIQHNIVVSLMKGDVSFETEDDIKKCISVLSRTRQHGELPVLVISRRNKKKLAGFSLCSRDKAGLPDYNSSDCWVFSPPQAISLDISFYSMGHMNCSSLLNYDWIESGRMLLNLSIDTSLIGHENNKKDNDLNENETTKNINKQHAILRSNVPFLSYGIAWNTVEWILSGYIPAPLKSYSKRIYIAFNSLSLDEHQKAVLFLTEVIAKRSLCDLVVLYEYTNKSNIELVSKVGKISQKVYFIEVENLKVVIKNLVFGKQDHHESVALVRDISYITPDLIGEFHSIVFDQRGNNKEINIPDGFSYLVSHTESRYDIKIEEKFSNKSKRTASCTLITSLYMTDSFISGFKDNITSLDEYESNVHIMLFSTLSEYEQDVILDFHSDHSNLIIGWYKIDPGLYGCWNIGIRLAPTEFISNANVDDLRHPKHLTTLVEVLRNQPSVSVCASAIVAFEVYNSELDKIDISNPWYINQAGVFGMESLASLEKNKNGGWGLVPINLPHCMPVWRKSLHYKYGYFDEKRFGTYADWAFWLKITKDGKKGYLVPKPFAFYFVNLNSHNRRGNKLKILHQEVEKEFLDAFYFRTKESGMSQYLDSNIRMSADIAPRKLNLSKGILTQEFGIHRNSFNRLIESLVFLHNEKGGIEFIPFIERYFVWGTDKGEASSDNPSPIKKDWIGILHVPFDAPKWFDQIVSPENIFKTDLWNQSIQHCLGIICLTDDLRKDLSYWYPSLPSLTIKHPTELDVVRFNWKIYSARKRLVQAGDWLRRLQAIYEVSAPDHEKIMLMKPNTSEYLRREIGVFGDKRNKSVKVLDMVSNEEYDELLSSSVVFIWLYASAANNIVLECISRCTPLIINPLPSVVEYLGKDYPLYINSLSEASQVIENQIKIQEAHEYLMTMDSIRNDLSYEKFGASLACSDFYARL